MEKIVNKHTWSIRTAGRLRALLASFPEASPETRINHLGEELEQALVEGTAHTENTRQSLLAALEDHFPDYAAAAVGAQTARGPQVAARAQDLSTGELVDELLARAGKLSLEEIRLLGTLASKPGTRDKESNASPAVTDWLTLPVSQAEIQDFKNTVTQLWQNLGLDRTSDTRLQLNRLLKLLGILADNFRKTYPVVWGAWTDLKRNLNTSDLKDKPSPAFEGTLPQVIGDLARGQGEINSAWFCSEVVRTTDMLFAICQGMPLGAYAYGRELHESLAPHAVKTKVNFRRNPRPPLPEGTQLDLACLKEYESIFQDKTATVFCDAIISFVADRTLGRFNYNQGPAPQPIPRPQISHP